MSDKCENDRTIQLRNKPCFRDTDGILQLRSTGVIQRSVQTPKTEYTGRHRFVPVASRFNYCNHSPKTETVILAYFVVR